MPVILVAEQDANEAQQIANSLRSAGWQVEIIADGSAALQSAAASGPSLLLVNATFPEAPQLVSTFSRSRGGPGTLVLVPPSVTDRAALTAGDATLAMPCSGEVLRQTVRQCLDQGAGAPAEPASPDQGLGNPASKRSSQQLTSADIFGDVLAEVEAEAERARQKRRERAKTSRAKKDDLDRRLEETLSGVLSVDQIRKRSSSRKSKASTSAEADVDALLGETLSSLELPPRPTSPATGPVAKAPSDPAAGIPELGPPASVPPEAPGPDPDTSAKDLPGTDGFAYPDTEADQEAPLEAEVTLPEIQVPEIPVPILPAPGETPPEVPETFEIPDLGSSGFETPPPHLTPPELDEPWAPAVHPADAHPADELPPSAEWEADFETERPPAEADVLPADTRSSAPGEAGAPATDLADIVSSMPDREPSNSTADLGFETFKTQPLPIVVSGESPGTSEPVPDEADLTPAEGDGAVFGDYTLLDRVAIGGMAEVWRARRRGVEGFQKTVAIKKILAHLTSSSDFVKMFIDEAKLAAQLNHHNIIQIYDLGKVGEDFFIAMEFVEGKDLRSILTRAKETRRPVPIGLSLLIVSAVARALDYAHRKRDFDDRDLGLVHRDVSPQNVLISYEGEIKLCDFGIVKAVSKTSTTQMGALKGKLQYMSPEQAQAKTVDARSDIFSLGSVFFELLTGEKLFTGDSEISVLDAVRECRPTSPRSLVPEIPREVESIVLKALAKEPDERYQTAGELEHDIKEVLDQLSPPPGLKDMASYLEALLQPYQAAGPDTAASYLPPPAAEAPEPTEAVAETPAMAPVAAPDTSPPAPAEKKKSSKGLRGLVVAAVLAGVLAAAGFLAWRGGRAGETPGALDPGLQPSEPAPTATVPAGEAGGAAPDSDPSAPENLASDATADEGPPGDAGEPAGDADAVGDTGSELADAGDDGSPQDEAAGDAPLPDGLEQLVEDAVTKKREQIEEQLSREFEERKRRLEAEIAKARDEGKPPPTEDGIQDDDPEGEGR